MKRTLNTTINRYEERNAVTFGYNDRSEVTSATICGIANGYGYDNIGNVTRYLDENGNTVAQYTYDAFGNTIAKSGPLADFFRHRFSSKYFDAESNLYYYGYRFYHPVLMRWLNRDPIEEDGGMNLYSFCLNIPLCRIDILGDTSVGQILEAFFSEKSTGPRLWIMREDDLYTTIVRKWDSVKRSIEIIKSKVAEDPKKWETSHITTINWEPKMQYGFDPRVGYEGLIVSPPGTDSVTARNAYIIFKLTTIQTDKLHTSSIGSYRIAATIDKISFNPCKATINVWMYNEMSRQSFGRFAKHWYFRNSSMQSQFMWWNWKERINFTSNGSYSDVQ